jgi:hypothetical protein
MTNPESSQGTSSPLGSRSLTQTANFSSVPSWRRVNAHPHFHPLAIALLAVARRVLARLTWPALALHCGTLCESLAQFWFSSSQN